jgi:hypothetical protein
LRIYSVCVKYFIMAQKKYKKYLLTLTDTTSELVYALQKYGHNIRDIINAGIVLYDQR